MAGRVVTSHERIPVQNLTGDLDGVVLAGQGLDKFVERLPRQLIELDVRLEERDEGIEVARFGLGADEKSLPLLQACDAVDLQTGS